MGDFVEVILVPVRDLLPVGLAEGDGAREGKYVEVTATEGGKHQKKTGMQSKCTTL